jgi:hypothetical protein
MTTGVKSYNGSLGVTQAREPQGLREREDERHDDAVGAGGSRRHGDGCDLDGDASRTRRPSATYAETVERDWESDKDVRLKVRLRAARISQRSWSTGRRRMVTASR